MLGGESVLSLVPETSVPEQTLNRWKHQALVHAGLVDGVDSGEHAQLRAARKRIKALEKELQLVKDASDLFDRTAVVDRRDVRPWRNNSRQPVIRSGKQLRRVG
jgi:transposase-like protein